jgi:hypothetical protein
MPLTRLRGVGVPLERAVLGVAHPLGEVVPGSDLPPVIVLANGERSELTAGPYVMVNQVVGVVEIEELGEVVTPTPAPT